MFVVVVINLFFQLINIILIICLIKFIIERDQIKIEDIEEKGGFAEIAPPKFKHKAYNPSKDPDRIMQGLEDNQF
jgi:hypothetical protein